MKFYPAPDQNGGPDYTFFLIMLVATAIAAAVNAYTDRMEQAGVLVRVSPRCGSVWWPSRPADRSCVSTSCPCRASWPMSPRGHRGRHRRRPRHRLRLLARRQVGIRAAGRPAECDDPASLRRTTCAGGGGLAAPRLGFGLPRAWMMACLLVLPLASTSPCSPVGGCLATGDDGQRPAAHLMCWNTDANGELHERLAIGPHGQTLMQLTERCTPTTTICAPS